MAYLLEIGPVPVYSLFFSCIQVQDTGFFGHPV
jgi:hypothetical protein